MGSPAQQDWISTTADQAIAASQAAGRSVVTCASGISPSGPIHLGNLREVMVPHFVADEITRRGVPCRHVLSWDDFDRFRKVPAEAPASFSEYIGRPLTGVPDPCGEHLNWAEHFKAPFRAALIAMGITIEEISQAQRYSDGVYAEQIVTAINARTRIETILAHHQTKTTPAETERTVAEYFPYKPYCAVCGRDTTTITGYEPSLTTAAYRCACGHESDVNVAGHSRGKLAWKVDWPMRWKYEGVDFEAGGADHSSPGSSFTVGRQIVGDVYGGTSPNYLAYSFVGVSGGSAKMSGSAGAAPTPIDALEILEPAILRWLYARRRPNQSITVAFDQEVLRIYDEWDSLTQRIRDGKAGPMEQLTWQRSTSPTSGALPTSRVRMPFRTLSSVADVTAGDSTQLLRILSEMHPTRLSAVSDVEPRLGLARRWITGYVPDEQRTVIRSEPDKDRLMALPEQQRDALRQFTTDLDDSWSLDGLTALVYGIPKRQLGLPLDTKPTPALKVAQREFFVLLYRLLIDAETGPRLPTLILAIGKDRILDLLRPDLR